MMAAYLLKYSKSISVSSSCIATSILRLHCDKGRDLHMYIRRSTPKYYEIVKLSHYYVLHVLHMYLATCVRSYLLIHM